MAFKRGLVIEVNPEDRDWFREWTLHLAIARPDLRTQSGRVTSPRAFRALREIIEQQERENA